MCLLHMPWTPVRLEETYVNQRIQKQRSSLPQVEIHNLLISQSRLRRTRRIVQIPLSQFRVRQRRQSILVPVFYFCIPIIKTLKGCQSAAARPQRIFSHRVECVEERRADVSNPLYMGIIGVLMLVIKDIALYGCEID